MLPSYFGGVVRVGEDVVPPIAVSQAKTKQRHSITGAIVGGVVLGGVTYLSLKRSSTKRGATTAGLVAASLGAATGYFVGKDL